MDQGRRSALIGALLAVACKSSEPPPAPSPPPPVVATPDARELPWPENFERALVEPRANVSKVMLALKQLEADGIVEQPVTDARLPGLDFERGDAILTSGTLDVRDPLVRVFTPRIVHTEDDPYRLAMYVDNAFSPPAPPETYRGARYRGALERLLRARYVVVVRGTGAQITFDGVAYVYELATTKLLAAIPLHADVAAGRGPEDNVLRLEVALREALWTALEKRSQSVKRLALRYDKIDDE